ncbi:hypothetical protein FKP32DRAFT_1593317 [Trametes sanguinea]|nr:hypothetical protein FKP32DRAFT_1593317 [Trametes sanguinea]
MRARGRTHKCTRPHPDTTQGLPAYVEAHGRPMRDGARSHDAYTPFGFTYSQSAWVGRKCSQKRCPFGRPYMFLELRGVGQGLAWEGYCLAILLVCVYAAAAAA